VSSPLINRLTEQLGYPIATPDSLAGLLASPECVVLFFAGNPQRYPECNDVAVILPELVNAFPGQLQPAVVSSEYEEALQQQYPFQRWPALVFLRSGVQVGAICRVHDWTAYLEQIAALIAKKVAPDSDIPIVHL